MSSLWTAIRRELREGFVTNMIMDSLPFSKPATRLEEMIREYLNAQNRINHLKTQERKSLWRSTGRMQNFLDAVEQGIGLDTILARIRELENEKKALEQERSRNWVVRAAGWEGTRRCWKSTESPLCGKWQTCLPNSAVR